MDIQAYRSFSEINGGRRLHIQTLKTRLRKFERSSLLFSLARINILLGRLRYVNYKHDVPTDEQRRWTQGLLNQNYLSPDIQSRLEIKDSLANPVFFRQQILFLIRLIILETRPFGNIKPDDSPANRYMLGECCLIASDHLLGPREQTDITTGTEAKRDWRLAYQLAPILDLYNPVEMKQGIARAAILYSEIMPSSEFLSGLPEDLSTVQWLDIFHEATGITIVEYKEFVIGILSMFLGISDEDLISKPELLMSDRTTLLRESSVSQTPLDLFLKLESGSVDSLRPSVTRLSKRVRSGFAFSALSRTPIIEIAPDKLVVADISFLVEKLGPGIFWMIFDNLRSQNERMRFLTFYGHLFEHYVNKILADSVHDAYFVPNPKYHGPGKNEVFDALIFYPETRHLVVIETKASLLRLDSKYGDSIRRFENAIKLKFLVNDKEEPKGVGQIAGHLNILFARDPSKRRKLIDVQRFVTDALRISPVLVVQERLLRYPALERRLNKYFTAMLNRSKLRDSVVVDNLTVIDIDTLERIRPHLSQGVITLEQCINARLHRDPTYKSNLLNFLLQNLSEFRTRVDDNVVESRFTEAFTRARDKFFPGTQWISDAE